MPHSPKCDTCEQEIVEPVELMGAVDIAYIGGYATPIVFCRQLLKDELCGVIYPQHTVVVDAVTNQIIYSPRMVDPEFLREETAEYLETHELWGKVGAPLIDMGARQSYQ